MHHLLLKMKIKECEAVMSQIERQQAELEIITHPVNAPAVFQEQVGEVNEASMSNRVLIEFCVLRRCSIDRFLH